MTTMVHRTPESNLAAILSEGLRVGMPVHLTDCGVWAHDWYETNPVFLAFPEAPYVRALDEGAVPSLIEIEVDAEGLSLVADLPSLCDTGAMLDEGVLWWEEGRVPGPLLEFVDEGGAIEIEYLLDPSTHVCRAAILATGTAACVSDVGPERLVLRTAPVSAP